MTSEYYEYNARVKLITFMIFYGAFWGADSVILIYFHIWVMFGKGKQVNPRKKM